MKMKKSMVAQAVAIVIGSVVVSGAAWAQSSEGSLYGTAPSGATVTITSIENGTTRQVKAGADGSFSAAKLAPGRYRVVAGNVTKEISVAIGSGSEVVLTDVARIEVTGSKIRSSIDMTSTESNSVYTAEQIRALPVGRSVDAVALLAPGTIKGDDFGSGLTLPSFAGASIAENGYYINGMDVTNIRNFLSYAELPFDAIGQTQIKTGGYGAEYGRSLGGVVSIVTKRGTNDWKGSASVIWEPKSLRSKGTDVADKEPDRAGLPYVFNSADTQENLSVVLTGGGPIIADKLFIFGALEAPYNQTDRYNQSGSERSRNTQPNAMVKVDWSVTDNHLLEFTGISNKKRYSITDWKSATDYSTTHDGVGQASTRDGGGSVLIGKYTGYLTDDLTVSALVGQVKDDVLRYTGYRTQGQDCPVVLDVDLSEIGCWIGPFPGNGKTDTSLGRDSDTRKSWRLDVDYNFGKHSLRAGIDNQTFNSVAGGGSNYTGPGTGQYYRYYIVGASGAINGVPGFTPGDSYVRQRIYTKTSGAYEVTNNAFYVEDKWQATKELSLYGGLRWESFNNFNGAGESFVKADNLLAPRVGFAWNLGGTGDTKIFGNLGRYYIPVASNTNIRATRAEFYEQTYYTNTGRDPVTQAPTGLSASIGNPQILASGQLPDPGTIADTKLKPMNQDELILGIQKALTPSIAVGGKIVYRKINAGMDDYCDTAAITKWVQNNLNPAFTGSTLAQCVLMNPGNDLNFRVDLNEDGNLVPVTIPASALGLAKYERTYKGIELSISKPFDNKWSFDASYTWSKSYGTAEGYVQSNLNQEDAGVTQDFDFGSFTDGSKGYLPNDRRHVFKFNGLYQVSDEWRIGANAIVASGRPLSCIGFVPPTVPDFAGSGQYSSASAYYCIVDPNQPAKLVPRGSVGRTPWTGTVDLSAEYIPAWAKKKLSLKVDIFNIFNSQKATELNEVRDYSRADSNSTTFPLRQNENYLSPTSFQTPRYVRLTARYDF